MIKLDYYNKKSKLALAPEAYQEAKIYLPDFDEDFLKFKNLESLTIDDYSSKNYRDKEMQFLKEFSKLTYLKLKNLLKFPEIVFEMKQLEVLEIAVKTSLKEEIPNRFDELTALKHLEIVELFHFNKTSNLPSLESIVKMRNLESLTIHVTRLSQFTELSLSGLSSLKKLEIKYANAEGASIKPLLQLASLEELKLIPSNYARNKDFLKVDKSEGYQLFKNIRILNLPGLNTSELKGLSENTVLEYLNLDNSSIQKLELCSEVLRSLHLESCKKLEQLSFQGNCGKNLEFIYLNNSKKLKGFSLNENINFAKVDSASFANLNLGYVPIKKADSYAFKYLNLVGNNLSSMPYYMGYLDEETILALKANPLYSLAPVRPDYGFKTLRKFFREKPEYKPFFDLAFALLFRDETYLASITTKQLLEIYLLKNSIVCKSVDDLLMRRIPAPDFSQSNVRLYLAGKLKEWDSKELEKQLKEKGIILVKKPQDATHMIFPENPSADCVNYAQLPLVLPMHLDYLLNEKDGFLVKIDQQSTNNLENLLMSSEKENFQLGLEMIEGGGIPENMYLCYLLLMLSGKANDKRVYELGMQHLPFFWKKIFDKYAKRDVVNRYKFKKNFISTLKNEVDMSEQEFDEIVKRFEANWSK